MQKDSELLTAPPPKIIVSVGAGFEVVSRNAYLILFPIVLDLFLWLGPRLRVKELFDPLIQSSINRVMLYGNSDLQAMAGSLREVWGPLLDQFNLFSAIQTIPVGVPGLMAGLNSLATPLGMPAVFEVSNSAAFLGIWLLLSVIGVLIGCFYFDAISRASAPEKHPFTMKALVWSSGQIFAFLALLIFVLLAGSLPLFIILSLISLISPMLVQGVMFMATLLLIWLAVPLFFTPHNIFANRLNVFKAISASVSLVRYFVPGTALFLLTLVLIGQGLDVLWRIPPTKSWLTLVGMFGHAVVITALISASFIYYQGGFARMQEMIRRMADDKGAA